MMPSEVGSLPNTFPIILIQLVLHNEQTLKIPSRAKATRTDYHHNIHNIDNVKLTRIFGSDPELFRHF